MDIPDGLRCEYLEDPLGIQNAKPRFSWTAGGGNAPGIQNGYRILVADSEEGINSGAGNVWDSGVVRSSASSGIAFGGKALESAKRYFWRVLVWTDDAGQAAESKVASFETGLFNPSDWKGKWIQAPRPQWGVSPLFLKHFELSGQAAEARVYISGIGYYELTVNGKRVGERQLEPGWTDYSKRVLYSVYDVGDLLSEGENTLGIQLGEGWYGHLHESFTKLIGRMPDWHGTPMVLCDLRVKTLDGRRVCIFSSDDAEEGWVCSEGPIRENNIYDGELYDARFEKPGWNLPGYVTDPAQWKPAAAAVEPCGMLVAQLMPPILETERLMPVQVRYVHRYSYTYDLGRNIAGWAEIKVRGMAGQKVVLSYGEVLNADHSVNQKNLRDAKARDIYILKGEGVETYKPRFTYHGFRYVQVEIDPGILIDGFAGYCVHSAVRRAGEFQCSSMLLNRIYNTVVQTERNNLHSVPTDCPQRDERLAWLNDMTVRCEEGLFNFDLLLFYEKWLEDISDAQDKITGSIPDTAPFFYGGRPASHVSSVYVLIPWLLYRFYGDKHAIERHYEGMKKYVAFLDSQTVDGLMDISYFGDWAPPMTECTLGWGENAVPANIPNQIITTGYLYYDCTILQKAAELLGRPEDVKYFGDIAEKAKNAVNRTFLCREKGYYRPNSQGANIFPLFLGIVPEELREDVFGNLVSELVNSDYRITTGNQATKYLYDVLDMERRNDLAYKLAAQEKYPSIGYMLANGATTVWERWELDDGPNMNSHDHPMHGAFSTWFYKAAGGIRPEHGLAGEVVRIAPQVIEGLSYARTAYETVKGRLESGWTQTEGRIEFNLRIPWNTLAEFIAPLEYGTETQIFVNGVKTDREAAMPEGESEKIRLLLRPGQYKIQIREGCKPWNRNIIRS